MEHNEATLDFRLGDLEVRPSLRAVVGPEGTSGVEARSMDVLVLLARRAGEVLTRDELLDGVWSGRAVGEEALTHAVWDLRRALDDDPRSPRFIQTVPKRGYRLVAKVSWLEPGVGDTARYRLIERLGGGAMGVVYRAEDTRLNRQVALKFLPPEWSRDADAKRRFMREARAASSLDHPNVCTIHDLDETDDGRLFIAMALYEGETLKKKVERGPLPTEEAIEWAGQVAEGLAAAHRQGMVHRDIKPANVLVTAEGVAKILDFGLAKLAGQTRITKTGSSLGTPAYMSPEQARGDEVDPRTDLWSLGVVLYELVTGTLPFRGASDQAVIHSILNQEPAALVSHGLDPPEGLPELLGRLLTKEVAARHPDADAVAAELRGLRDLRRAPEARLAPSPERRPRGRWLAATVLATTVGVAAWYYLLSPSVSIETGLRATPLTSLPGQEEWPALSPSGDRLAYVWNGGDDGYFHLYVRLVAGGDAVQLTDHAADDYSPVWSPDGQQIAFLRTIEPGFWGTSEVVTLPALGGPERRLGTISSADDYDRGWSPGLDWSPDGRHLAVVDRRPGDVSSSIFLLSLETIERRRLTDPPPGVGDKQPAFAPDGQSLAFIRRDIHVQSLGGGEPEPLGLTLPRLLLDLDWVADGSAIVFSSASESEAGSDLRQVPIGGGAATVLPFGSMAETLSIASRGPGLVYDQRSWFNRDLWRVPGPNAPKRGPATRLTSASRADWGARYSPDGASIAFASERGGANNIWRCASDGTRCSQLTHMRRASNPSWSPDGGSLLFRGDGEHDGFHLMDLESRLVRPLTLEAELAVGLSATWSQDGREIFFAARRGKQRFQVWKVPASGGAALQITRQGGRRPQGSPQGELLYYEVGSEDPADTELGGGILAETAGPYCRIMRVPARGGEERPVTEERKVNCGAWAPWKNSLVYLSGSGRTTYLELLDLDSKQVARLHTFDRDVADVTVSPDGRWVVVSVQPPRTSDVMWVEGFR